MDSILSNLINNKAVIVLVHKSKGLRLLRSFLDIADAITVTKFLNDLKYCTSPDSVQYISSRLWESFSGNIERVEFEQLISCIVNGNIDEVSFYVLRDLKSLKFSISDL